MDKEYILRLNKKLAEWAGWQDFKLVPAFMGEYSMMGAVEGKEVRAWAFTGSLDACFNWLIPKLLGGYQLWNTEEYKHHCEAWVDSKSSTIGIAETPSMAVCLAIEHLIDDKC